jgi:aspartate-semialdehyde dehydrogenase
MSRGYRVAIVGATGAVGQELIAVLQERDFPISDLKMLADAQSDGPKVKFGDNAIPQDDFYFTHSFSLPDGSPQF